MRRRRQFRTKKRKKRGKRIPYIYKNRIYFGKRPQTGSGAVSHIIARLLENVGDVIGLEWSRESIK